ncbi:carboxypeptidase Ss1. Metallo peptidase. MEROPS family M20D [Fontimonas thermophila]|uniref:Carboxypeptidase Ss1. Metallo peptidase. MEROPS family M20D n=1 Tax=Fontimonas thermophila TaxID=1076937 RepID=A0A1I2HVK6_9GAMM|nr:amidohydrolase [Fontimonas thermophila]SFF33852.1 carboxypeptidase Ss1. Metallo peptidase. MEROPS family M20D [Fontimonas thermophila]
MGILHTASAVSVAAVLSQTLSQMPPASPDTRDLQALINAVQPHVIEHRRHLHAHPELSNREFATAAYIAEQLRALGVPVETGIARTGVVGVIKGARPGPVIALRADMDALPVTEQTDVPFRSTVRTTYDGKEVGVMHACGHDGHMAILLGVAEVLMQQRDILPGTVKLIFQPAEEGPPPGEEGGAAQMIREGVLRNDPQPEAIFGLHLLSQFEVGRVGYRSGGIMASADDLRIVVRGKQTHGAAPWLGIDPIVAAAQIVLGLQTIPSRQTEATKAPVIVSIGKIEGGVRDNIIPDRVEMKGTLRALDENMRQDLHARVQRTAEKIAEASSASAEVFIAERHAYPVTYNDPALMARMLPGLRQAFGDALFEAQPILGAEDFSFFQREIPGLYFFVGIRPPHIPPDEFPANHSPHFTMDEHALATGMRLFLHLVWDYLDGRREP